MALPILDNIMSAPFTVQPHPTKGRAVSATRRLPANTVLLKTGPPAAYTLDKQYRREVCARCFAYDRGVAWKLRLEQQPPRQGRLASGKAKASSSGLGPPVVFCSETCRDVWLLRQGTVGLQAWTVAWEIGSRQKGRKEREDDGKPIPSRRPSAGDIQAAWAEVEDRVGGQLREMRMRELEEDLEPALLTRAEKRLSLGAHQVKPAPSVETLSFILTGVLSHYAIHSQDNKANDDTDWTRIEALHQNPTPYASMEELQDCVNAYQAVGASLFSSSLTCRKSPG